MDPLYKIVKQLTPQEFEEIHSNFIQHKAERSAAFLKTIRESDQPFEDFLKENDIKAAAFYVLKARLKQKVEDYLLSKIGDPELEIVHKVLKTWEVIFNSPREIAIGTLTRLEKSMLELDNPSALISVYRGLKMLHNTDPEKRAEYEKLQNQSAAFFLGLEKGIDFLMGFFRSFQKFYLGRKDKDLNDMVGFIEKINNLSNLYASKKLFIYKSICHLFARSLVPIPAHVFDIMEDEEETFLRSFEILKENSEDLLFKNLDMIFNYLRYLYYEREGANEMAKIYFEILDYKVKPLLTGFNFGMDCSQILFFKLDRHIKEGSFDVLQSDSEYLEKEIEVDPSNVVPYINYALYRSYVAFYLKDYEQCSRVLYRLTNEINLRKYNFIGVEVKVFLALVYIVREEEDLSTQILLHLQRQLKKSNYEKYNHVLFLLKILSKANGKKTARKAEYVRTNMVEFEKMNKGDLQILKYLKFDKNLIPL